MRKSLSMIALLTVLAAGPAVPRSVDAGNRRVERTFAGRIIVTKKRAPARFRSQGHFIRWLRAHRVKHLWPVKSTAHTEKKRWKFEFMAFFRRKLNDFEVNIKFYDITEGKKFIAADNFMLRNRGLRVFASNLSVEQPRFAVNRKYLMYVLDARNRVLAKTRFWLRGKRTTYSGRVTFSDEEAKLKR